LEICRIPFVKEKSSDENIHVPNIPVFLNSLCPLLKYETPDRSMDYEAMCVEIANTISEIASYGIQELKETEGMKLNFHFLTCYS
jgi:hypothetical protein